MFYQKPRFLIEDACGGSSPPPKHLAPTICEYCVSISAFQMQKLKQKQKQKQKQKEKQQQKKWEVDFTVEIISTLVETKAQMRTSADKKMLR